MPAFPSQRDHPLVGGILVRLRAASELWIERVPPVPGGHVLTATVSSQSLGRIPADELVSRGIRIVGRHVPPKLGRGTVDLLVPTALVEDAGPWLRQLLTQAERVFDLSHGPVRLVFADEIETHINGRSRPN